MTETDQAQTTIRGQVFKPYNRAVSGFLGDAHVRYDGETMLVTARLVASRTQHRLRLMMAALLGLAVLGPLGLAIWAGFLPDLNQVPTEYAVAAATYIVLVLAYTVTLAVYGVRMRHAARLVELRVPAQAVTDVHVHHNLHHLWWGLLIGPFALIPFFAGRRVLRMSVPSEDPSRPLRLTMRETFHGDAEHVATELRTVTVR